MRKALSNVRHRLQHAVIVRAAVALLLLPSLVVTGAAHAQSQQSPALPQAACTDSLWLAHGNPGGPWLDVMRLAQLDDTRRVPSSLLIRRSGSVHAAAACGTSALQKLAAGIAGTEPMLPGLALLPVHVDAVHNSAYPRHANDGVLWAGRGSAAQIAGGVELRWGPITGRLSPVFAYQQNADVDVFPSQREGRHPLSDAWVGDIDLPQRFGTESFNVVDAGPSFLRLDAYGIALGVSNENLWWGPGRHNALILSSAAPGFPHAFLETARPVNVGIGRAEGQMFWGRLNESDFFDMDPVNDQRLFAGMALVLEPRGADGLFIGLTRAVHRHYAQDSMSLNDIFLGPYRNVRDNVQGVEGDNQLVSLFFRWAVAGAGIDVYGEWGREDHWEHLESLLKIPDASQAFLLGLQKLIAAGGERRVRVGAEIIKLSDPLPILHAGRGVGTFYLHFPLVQGHTHRGQPLGAWIGPGSDAQILDVDLFWEHGQTGLTIERVRYNVDAYYATWSSTYGPHGHDAEISLRARHRLARNAFAVSAELGVSQRYSRSFLGLDWTNSPDRVYRKENNVQARLTMQWRPQLRLWQPQTAIMPAQPPPGS